ncbi:MAG: 16S rRNA (guanine(527)-N(7))-methyltransferase RsmG [Clostridia bacterium]|nr:16S rRNA (guanine(527)-N(7))-methyltransferase RsmG [Clostridia bacterium]
MDFSQLLSTSFEKNGLPAPDTALARMFACFTEHLLAVNQITNLTAIRDVPSVITKHYVDSLLIADAIPTNARVLDIGCGPGFPSIPLAIFRPDLTIVSLDSTAKKIAFVKESTNILSLNNLTAISGRAEDRSVMKELGFFDVVTSRAVANLSVLCELCLPYLKIGGKMLAMKGAKIEDEVDELLHGKAIGLLGGSEPTIRTWQLFSDNSAETRGVVEIFKEKECGKQYPRAYAAIIKSPL